MDKTGKAKRPNLSVNKWQVTVEAIVAAIKHTQNWKAPCPDTLPNFWLKQFTALHEVLTKAINSALGDPVNLPRQLRYQRDSNNYEEPN